MKRSNFLATIAAFFLAPFGIKAKSKSEYTIFKAVPFLPGEERFWASGRIMIDAGMPAPRNFMSCPGFTILMPPVPDDGKEHDICVKYDCGKLQYFVDGKQINHRSFPQ